MNETIKIRVLEEADIIVNTKQTLRALEKHLSVSKSTIHKDMQSRLRKIDENKYNEVQKIFSSHIETRHLHGGEATRKKYMSKSPNL